MALQGKVRAIPYVGWPFFLLEPTPRIKLTQWPLSDGAGKAAETRSRKIRDLRAKAGDTRLNESRVQGRIGRKIFRSEEKQKRGLR